MNNKKATHEHKLNYEFKTQHWQMRKDENIQILTFV